MNRFRRSFVAWLTLIAASWPMLASAYPLEIEIVPVAHPSIAANPAPDMLQQHAIRDAALLAES